MFNYKDLFFESDNFKYFTIILVCSVLIVLISLRKYFQYCEITSKIKTFYGWPLVGTVFQVLPMNKFLYKLGNYFNDSLTFFTWLGMKPLILTIEPELIKQILNKEEFLNKANVLYQSMDAALPNGLITSKFFKWKHNRKLMNPSFSPKILHTFLPIFLRHTDKISQHFDSLLDGYEHSIFEFLQKTIMEVALETIMGLELKADDTLSSEMVTNMHNLMEKICVDTALTPLKLGFLVRDSLYHKILEYLQTFLNKLISRKTEKYFLNEGVEFFLNRALKYQKQGLFLQEDTIIETYTMISGSYETTSTTLYSLIVMLAMHPKVQEKLYQDILKVVPDNEQISYEHFNHLPYLNMVISETLRLVPPIPFIGRQTLERCKFKDEVILPRDFQVLISIFHLHRCKNLWGPNADKFNPDNFLSEEIEKRHPYAYVPYSKGVRNCIGWRYADISLKFLLLGLVRKYKFSTSFPYEDLYFVQKISLQYLREPEIKITKRL